MKLDWIAKCFTGQDTKLLNSFEDKMKTQSSDEQTREKTLEEKVKEEDQMLKNLERVGFKIT